MRVFEIEEAVAVLERTPAVLDSLLRGLPAGWLTADEGPGTFSAWEVLGHLVHGEKADWVGRARIILEEGEERPFDPFDRFAHRTESAGRSAEELLDEFRTLRRANLETVRAWDLTEDQLSLKGRHPALGTVTLRQLIATWAVHDLAHLGQMARVMAKRYGEAVGPWKEYIRILGT